MVLDRFPGAAGGDAHGLVVVADAAAGGEGVVQPEAVVVRDPVGDVGEGCRALVGGDHQVGVVVVAADHPVRRHDQAGVPVVGQVEQPGDEHPVAGDAFGKLLFAVGLRIAGGRRRALDDEAALGPDRDDDGVLDLLRLDQAEDLGAEVLRPVRPAQAAAGDVPEPQVYAFQPRRVHPDLMGRNGFRHARDLVRVELDGQEVAPVALVVQPVFVGPRGRPDHAEHGAQDPVGVQAGHRVQGGGDAGRDPLGLCDRAARQRRR